MKKVVNMVCGNNDMMRIFNKYFDFTTHRPDEGYEVRYNGEVIREMYFVPHLQKVEIWLDSLSEIPIVIYLTEPATRIIGVFEI